MSERLLIMRHGEAAPGSPDIDRPLTERGIKESRRVGAWLAGRDDLAGLRLLASPYRRAQQTADAIAVALDREVETLSIITPDDAPDAVEEWLLEQAGQGPLMLVSHMPLVSVLTGWLVEGREAQGPGFPTAAIAELEGDLLTRGCARLLRFTAPSDLA